MLSEDLHIRNEAPDFATIAAQASAIRWMERAMLVFCLDRRDGVEGILSRVVASVYAVVNLGFIGVNLADLVASDPNWTLRVVFATWGMYCSGIVLVHAWILSPHWFRHLVVNLTVSSWELVEIEDNEGGEGVVGVPDELPRVRGEDVVSTQSVCTFNTWAGYGLLLSVIVAVSNAALGAALFVDMGLISDVYRDLPAAMGESLGVKTLFLVVYICSSIVWVTPIPPMAIAMYLMHKQFLWLTDKVKRRRVVDAGIVSRLHKVIHRRTVFFSAFAQWPLALTFVLHAGLAVFLSYRLVLVQVSAGLLVVQIGWLVSGAGLVLLLAFLGAFIHSSGKDAVVFALADSRVESEQDRDKLSFALSTIDRRDAGFRLFNTLSITFASIAKIISAYATLLTVLYNIRERP